MSQGRDYRTGPSVTHSTKAHSLALVLVDQLGPRVAEATLDAIGHELGSHGGWYALKDFDPVKRASALDVSGGEMKATIERLEDLRAIGLAIEEVLETKKLRDS